MSLTMLHMDVVCTSGAAQTRQTLCTALLNKLRVAQLHHNFPTLTQLEKSLIFSTDENNYDLESVLTFHFHFYDPTYTITINLINMIKYSFL
jgi:hypothetical protein